ncbi:MAG: cyclopropane-fatty-acyl-phospholipid synthase family protein [Hyphomicrobiales bacterium]
MRFLPKLLNKAVKSGTLTLIEPDGNRTSFGEPDGSKPVTMKIHDKSLDWKIAFNPELKTAEAYMDGTLTFEDGEVYDLLTLFYRNRRHFDHSANMIFWSGVARSMKRLHQHNPISKSRANVKHHYDLKDELFDLFLDEDKQYSCAYFPSGDETLEEAQTAKKSHIISKLNLKPGQKVLDIGCGWGGMALQIAATEDVTVKGITLSDNQARIARQRAEEAGVSDRVSFEICDYRELDEKFDRIVSVGMLEHVGAPHLKEYFLTVRNMLGPDGVALVHSISTKSPPGVTGPFIRKYIFPNGYSPALSEIVAAIEPTGLWVLDVEVWRKHYGFTLNEWRKRFAERRDEAVAMYDERFARMWEFYLAASEGVFMYGSSCVVQLQIGRQRDGVPLSRDYMYD